MRPISSISISVQQFTPRPVNEFDFQKTKKNQETVCSTFGSEKLLTMSKIHPFWKCRSSVVENNTNQT